jgi:hypothetical protein
MAKATSTKKVSDIPLLDPREIDAIKIAESKEVYDAEKLDITYDEPKQYIEPPKQNKASDAKLSFEERIEAFIEDKKEYVKLNDFLKSLYPIPKFNEPPVYINKGEMKRMRILLDNMQSHGKIEIKDNGHGKLGNHYYEGEQQYAKFHHIGNLTI